MKPFKLLTLGQQRESYQKYLRRSYTVSRNRILIKYESNIEAIDNIKIKIKKQTQKIDKIQDVIANKADKKYKGWNVWREDKKLLKKVFEEMENACQDVYLKIEQYNSRIHVLSVPLDNELAELDNLHHKLASEYV